MKITDIPDDHFKGRKTVEMELPWLTAESILYLDNFLKPNFEVLEFGSGGSTLFFSRRCQRVTSFETNIKWFNRIKEIINEKALNNISYFYIDEYKEVCDKKLFDCILVDTISDGKVERVDLMDFSLSHLRENGIIVLDNYGRYNYSIPEFEEIAYNDPHWCGRGTKIYKKKSL